jgi:arabinogalactan endo-1,4-beta-galactosidase
MYVMPRKRFWASIAGIALLGILTLVLLPEARMRSAPILVNPGFEPGGEGNPLRGWATTGIIEIDGPTGKHYLTHPGGNGPVETTQTLHNISNGWYTLKAWVRSSGKQQEAYIALKDCGDEEARTSVPIAGDEHWLQIVVSARVINHRCTISLYSDAGAGEWVSFDDIEFVPGRALLDIRGADISSLKKSEDKGGVYAYEDGRTGDALEILHDHGMNYARIRVWVDSPDGYHQKEQLLEMAKRLKTNGLKLLVDFHYSDSWADPGKQNKPAAWSDLNFEQLRQALYDHTYDVCNRLKAQGTPPDMVQIGNEINNGMLWPDGHADNWDRLAALLKEGFRAVKDCSPSTLVMLHIAEGGDNQLARWWFDHAVERSVPFDVIGISYYPYWHGTLFDLQNNLNDIALRYNRDIIVVETAYPFTNQENDDSPNIIPSPNISGYPTTPEGQRKMLADVMSIVRAIPDGHGRGVFYWDATWTAVPGNGWDPADPGSGNGWENQALFDYENRALPAMTLFSQP